MDLRQHPRYEVALTSSFLGDEINGNGTVKNLCLGGCAIVSDCTLRVGAFVELTIDLPEEFGPLQVEVAVVRWKIGTKFGLDFLQLGQDQQSRLRRWLKSM